jgi:uncharacterized iron-regulated membrane protein
LKPVHTWIGIIAGGLLAILGLTGSVIVSRDELKRTALPRSSPTHEADSVDTAATRSYEAVAGRPDSPCTAARRAQRSLDVSSRIR